MSDILWFMLGLFVGGFLGMMTMALMVVASRADRNLEEQRELRLIKMLEGQPMTGSFQFKEPTGIRIIEDEDGLRTDDPPPSKI